MSCSILTEYFSKFVSKSVFVILLQVGTNGFYSKAVRTSLHFYLLVPLSTNWYGFTTEYLVRLINFANVSHVHTSTYRLLPTRVTGNLLSRIN
jgi:hypothetical protein